MVERGRFIVVEGTDGSGLSTQTALLRAALADAGHAVWATKEPTDGPAGGLIRLALSHRLGGQSTDELFIPFDPAALALLFAADRLDHCATAIAPRLQAGTHVLCDRYVLSSLAYQGLRSDRSWIQEINSRALSPDLTIFLDVPPETCAARITSRGGTRELFEQTETLRQVRARYLALLDDPAVAPLRGRTIIVDGQGSIDQVQSTIRAAIFPFLPNPRSR